MLAPNPHSLAALISWLEKQPPEKIYVYTDAETCLAAQYRASIGETYSYVHTLNTKDEFTPLLEKIASNSCGRRSEIGTFGAALDYARKLQKEEA